MSKGASVKNELAGTWQQQILVFQLKGLSLKFKFHDFPLAKGFCICQELRILEIFI